ncbi:hypothetical protein EON77_20255 [bacterium]|nr:MAG: hypothetical protein EON77_20255 [bacterium]
MSGSVVWRVRDRLRFRAAPTLENDALYAVAGGVNSATNLHAIDAFSGDVRWTRPAEASSAPCTVEGAPLVAGDVVVLAVRDRKGLRLAAFDREDGRPRWSTRGAVAPIGTSWLVVDDRLVGNSPSGELLAFDTRSGELAYRQLLGTALDTDVPRRLEPVLRSGALFVPFSDVHVIRPRDGASLGAIAPCDVIPDLMRVDEQCNVYVAEESGHVAAFGCGPRLSLVARQD